MPDSAKKLIKEFIYLLDIKEETDNGVQFHPNRISSVRVFDTHRLNEILKGFRRIANA